jgi:hypothetical protein
LDVSREKEGESMAYLCVSPGERRECGVCVGEEGHKDGGKAEKEDKTAGDKL